jgi:hypothetical protein
VTAVLGVGGALRGRSVSVSADTEGNVFCVIA